MLARLQQLVVVTLLGLAAAWAWHFARVGSPVLAVVGAVLIAFCHAPVLAIEFALLSWLNRRDTAPPAALAQLLGAWWGEVRTSARVFGWLQPFRSHAVPDFLPPGAARRGVLLVHGYFCNRGLWNPWLLRLRAQGVPCIAVTMEPAFGSIDDYADALEAAAQRLRSATGLAPVVVAHSMGGLAVRAWLNARAASTPLQDRPHRVLTIGSPHRGTFLAQFGLTRNAVQMRLGHEWHTGLAGREQAEGFGRFTCFYGHCDNVVFPASTATLPGADNRHLPGCAHVQMAYHPEVVAEAERWLASDTLPEPATTLEPASAGESTGVPAR